MLLGDDLMPGSPTTLNMTRLRLKRFTDVMQLTVHVLSVTHLTFMLVSLTYIKVQTLKKYQVSYPRNDAVRR